MIYTYCTENGIQNVSFQDENLKNEYYEEIPINYYGSFDSNNCKISFVARVDKNTENIELIMAYIDNVYRAENALALLSKHMCNEDGVYVVQHSCIKEGIFYA